MSLSSIKKHCESCGAGFEVRNVVPYRNRRTCGERCRLKIVSAKLSKPVKMYKKVCANCRKPFTSRDHRQRICSLSCMRKWTGAINQRNLLTPGPIRNAALDRLKTNHSMSTLKGRRHLSRVLRKMGHRPIAPGGNGRPTPIPQRMIYDLLGAGFQMEFVQPTGSRRVKGGLPTHYKIDIANVAAKVAIEIDGSSHNSQKGRDRDQRKSEILAAQGWCVLRFTNAEVMNSAASVVKKIRSHCTI